MTKRILERTDDTSHTIEKTQIIEDGLVSRIKTQPAKHNQQRGAKKISSGNGSWVFELESDKTVVMWCPISFSFRCHAHSVVGKTSDFPDLKIHK